MSAKLKPLIAKLKPVIKHPLIIGFLIEILAGAIVFLAMEQRVIKPRYTISRSEMIAETTADPPRLTLLWDNEEIQNVHSIKIAIWNAGRQYLDTNSISTTDPIRVTYPPDTTILYANFIRTSRDNLSLTATDLSSTGTRAIQIEIVGDEALERNDGGLLKILYTKQSDNGFTVTGRIKGCIQGFREISWGRVTWPKEPFFYPDIVVYSLWIPGGVYLLWFAIRSRHDRMVMFSSLFAAAVFLVLGTNSLYILIQRLSSPHWIN